MKTTAGAPVVVVGASVAGVRAALTLRQVAPEVPVVLLGDEVHAPYDRPPLSKEYLARQPGHDGPSSLAAPGELENAGVELRLGTEAVALRPADRLVRLASGQALEYSTLVVCSGASARLPRWPGGEDALVLRDLPSAERLRGRLSTARRLLVVGAGFIGSEVVGTAVSLGVEVHLVDIDPVPMARIAGPEVGAILSGLHARRGVHTRFGVSVATMRREGHEFEVVLSDGTTLVVDDVLAGLGAVPNTAWLTDSGLTLDDGVVCDSTCRAVGFDNVYAAGDVARWYHPGLGRAVRLEHWTNAIEQATYVARAIGSGPASAFTPDPFVWSNQHDWRLQVLGWPSSASGPVIVGTTAGDVPRFAALYAGDDGILRGAVTVNWARAGLTCRRAFGAPVGQVALTLAA